MRKLTFVFASLLVLSCQNSEEVPGQILAASGEEPPIENNDPQIVQDFFIISDEIVGDDYCYSRSAIREIMDSDDMIYVEGWSTYTIGKNGASLYMDNEECMSSIEFTTFDKEGEKYAYLNQVDRSSQQFDLLKFNAEKETWEKSGAIPMPDLRDYFENLNDEQIGWVEEFGYQFLYIEGEGNEAELKWIFSDWQFAGNLEAEGIVFEREADFEFTVSWEEEGLLLKQTSPNE